MIVLEINLRTFELSNFRTLLLPPVGAVDDAVNFGRELVVARVGLRLGYLAVVHGRVQLRPVSLQDHALQSRGVQGWVIVQFTITPAGTVKDAKVVAYDRCNGYRGSIYAGMPTIPSNINVHLDVPGLSNGRGANFMYVWEPGVLP